MQQTQDRLALEPKLVAMKEKVREEQEGRAAEAVKIRPVDSELDERNGELGWKYPPALRIQAIIALL